MNNEAEKAAEIANEKLRTAIDNHESFIFEAGPGAGKTYSLHKSLDYIIKKYSEDIKNNHQKIACISFTNTAVDEIKDRVEKNPLIDPNTIHGFCWNFMNGYQKEMRNIISNEEKWRKKIEETEIEIKKQKILYETGNKREITEKEIHLTHNDIPLIFSKLCKYTKFCAILINNYPFLFIDEYQDTNKYFVNSLIEAYESTKNSSIIGLFGDHWQAIYDNDTCGKITDKRLKIINKEANFRSYTNIVEFLNKLRPKLIQYPNKQKKGLIKVYHTNSWDGKRKGGSQWKGELQDEERIKYFKIVKKRFSSECKNASDGKILILTHKLLSSYQNYENILKSFRFNDNVIKKENEYISFLIDLENMIEYYDNNKYAEFFQLNNIKISSIDDKKLIKTEIESIKNMRKNKTIGEVIEHLKSCKKIKLNPKIEKLENKLNKYLKNEEEHNRQFDEIVKLKEVQYSEIPPLKEYIEEHTPFSTQHNVKGEEYENILAVFGKGWNKYNFNEMIENMGTDNNDNKFIQSRNLFYVCVSRAICNLHILFTEKLSEKSLNKIKDMVGEENVIDIVNENNDMSSNIK